MRLPLILLAWCLTAQATTPPPPVAALTDVQQIAGVFGGGRLGWGGGLGDFDGDGHLDLALSAPGEQRVYVHNGGPSGFAPEPTSTLTSPFDNRSSFGSAMAVGDVDRDGRTDVAVAVVSSFGTDRVVVFRGARADRTSVVEDPSGAKLTAMFGASLAMDSDVTGDGFSDLVVGDPAASGPAGAETGAVYVFAGGKGGVSATPTATILGVRPGGRLGTALDTSADLDGDGVADLIVTSTAVDEASGAVSVFLGGPTLTQGAPLWADLFPGEDAPGFGRLVSHVGDVDGDGRQDVAVAGDGVLYLFNGPAGGHVKPSQKLTRTGTRWPVALCALGDVDGDGRDDVLASSTLDAWFLAGTQGQPLTARTQVLAGAGREHDCLTGGDLNADGRADMVLIDPGWRLPGGNQVGRAVVYNGEAQD